MHVQEVAASPLSSEAALRPGVTGEVCSARQCLHWPMQWLICAGTARVVNGTTTSGMLQVWDCSWGTVCDDLFDNAAASVVCRQLGLGSSGTTVANGPFGSGTGWILMDNVQCRGSEATLQECPSSGWGVSDCGHSEDIGVRCSGTPLPASSSFKGESAHPPNKRCACSCLGQALVHSALLAHGCERLPLLLPQAWCGW